MKKIIKPAEKEESLYFSDFTGKSLGEYSPPIEIKIEFNYGSSYDGASLNLHLDDQDVKNLMEVIKTNLSSDTKEQLKKVLEKEEVNYENSMQFRDWTSCDYTINTLWFLRDLLDLKED